MKAENPNRNVKFAAMTRFLVTFATSIVIAALGSLIYIYQQFVVEQKGFQSDEALRLALGSKFIARTLQDISTDIRSLADSTTMSDFLRDPNNKTTVRLQAEFLNLVKHTEMYDQIRVISQSGMEQIRVNFNAGVPVVVDSSRLQDKSGRYYFTEAMAVDRGQIYISPLDLNVEDGVVEQPFKPTIRCAIPLFVGENVKPVGVLVLNYMAAQMLQDFEHMMTNSWGIP
ncbi:MAG: hypothetical protein PVH04_08500, partial [Gammaproteobacteria bacterium]